MDGRRGFQPLPIYCLVWSLRLWMWWYMQGCVKNADVCQLIVKTKDYWRLVSCSVLDKLSSFLESQWVLAGGLAPGKREEVPTPSTSLAISLGGFRESAADQVMRLFPSCQGAHCASLSTSWLQSCTFASPHAHCFPCSLLYVNYC